jgi:hypothetical protein
MYKHAKSKRPEWSPGGAAVVRYTMTRNQHGWYVRRSFKRYPTKADALEAFDRWPAHGATHVRMYLGAELVGEFGDPDVRRLWFVDQARKASAVAGA